MKLLDHMKSIFKKSMPESDRAEYHLSISKINVARAKITAALIIALEVLMLVVHYLMHRENLFEKPYIYYGSMYVLLLLFMIGFLAAFMRLGADVAKNSSRIRAVGTLFIGFVLLWCAGISLLDQLSNGQVIVYTIAVISIAIMPVIKPHVLFFVYFVVHVLFLIAMPYFQESKQLIYGNSVNSTAFVVIACAIAYMRYQKQVEDFINKKTILQKNEELKRINKQLQEANQKLEMISKTDGLTGITNRLSFESVLRDEWDNCMQHSTPLSLIMIDIDYFKEYNDHYGHPAGDRCIKLIANLLTMYAKDPTYKVARYGGDELIIVLPYTDKEKAWNLAEQIRKGVEEKALPHMYSEAAKHVTISLGVNTVVPSDNVSIEEFIRNTDQALYKAKERRNCSVCAAYRP